MTLNILVYDRSCREEGNRCNKNDPFLYASISPRKYYQFVVCQVFSYLIVSIVLFYILINPKLLQMYTKTILNLIKRTLMTVLELLKHSLPAILFQLFGMKVILYKPSYKQEHHLPSVSISPTKQKEVQDFQLGQIFVETRLDREINNRLAKASQCFSR